MLLSIDTGVSALEQFQQHINVIANNIANVNTVGFKESNVNFADTLSETLGSNCGRLHAGWHGRDDREHHQRLFHAGRHSTSTGVQSDLAINGNGFFVVKDPTTRRHLCHPGRHFQRGCQTAIW